MGFPGGSVVKNPLANAGDAGLTRVPRGPPGEEAADPPRSPGGPVYLTYMQSTS